MNQPNSNEVILIGGGVIGLSIAYELTCRGQQVRILERGNQIAREASWAGAGILPPANPDSALNPCEKLRGISHRLHPQWAKRLQQESGIDTGFRQCGGIYLAKKPGEAASLAGYISMLNEEGIAASFLSKDKLLAIEPTLDPDQFQAAYLLPDEMTLRNPRHVKALAKACELRGVRIDTQCEVLDFESSDGIITGLRTTAGPVTGGQYCITSGALSSELLKQVTAIPTGIVPIRGQMILFEASKSLIHHILSEGSRYLVPRADGKVLAGSCEEEGGFQKGTTPEILNQLADFAYSLVPALKEHEITMSWSGLRPGSFDGMPYIGKIPNIDNLFMASGHFRSGIHLSTGTAVLMADLLEGKDSEISVEHFGIIR